MPSPKKSPKEKAEFAPPVSPRTMRHAYAVIDADNEPLVEAVSAGHLAVSVAEKLVRIGVSADEVRNIAREAAEAVQASGPDEDTEQLASAIYRRGASRLLKAHTRNKKSRTVRRTSSREKVPEHLADTFERRDRLFNLVTTMRSRFLDLVEESVQGVTDSTFKDFLPAETLATLRVWVDDVILHLPEELCPVCAGAGCDICEHGWLSKATLVQLAPKLKAAALRGSPSHSYSPKKQR